jgi:hypothetical protein
VLLASPDRIALRRQTSSRSVEPRSTVVKPVLPGRGDGSFQTAQAFGAGGRALTRVLSKDVLERATMLPHIELRVALVSLSGICFLWTAGVSAADTVQISTDPFTNPSSQHMTEVEPQIYANGSTIVATFQQGRFFGGGSSDIGFATSTNSGVTWQNGSLPGITIWAGGDRYQSVSDPSVAYNAAFGIWLIVTLPVGFGTQEIFVSRSADGLNWDSPITVNSGSSSFDKPWMTCDNSPTSQFFGNCYIEWDDVGDGDRLLMSTSTDGGATWGLPLNTADRANGLGGQPLVQPSGRVVVPYQSFNPYSTRAFISDDGGNSWSSSISVASITEHPVAGELRDFDLPSAAIDGNGTIYVVWADCRFRTSCRANDVAMVRSSDGLNWSAVTRVPIDDPTSDADHFLAGLGADRNSFAPNVGLALVYYYYPQGNCTSSTCQLTAGFITSRDGGGSWSVPIDVAGPMSTSWLPSTISGQMVGDYFSVFYTDDGIPHPVFADASEPMGMFFESMFSTCVDCGSPAATRPKVARCEGPNCSPLSGVEPVAEEWKREAAESQSGALRVSAEAYRVNIGAHLTLVASGPATRNAAVDWTVEEGALGGSVSSSGVYIAPLSPGIYHVVASSGSERARLAIKVFTVR